MTQLATITKFGGTSLEDHVAFDRVAQIIASRRELNPVVVISAMSGITDALLAAVRLSVHGDWKTAASSLQKHMIRYQMAADELLSEQAIQEIKEELDVAGREISDLLRILAAHPVTRPPLQDEILSYGERLCAQLMAAVLRDRDLPGVYVDARRFIKTDDTFGNAAPLIDETASLTRLEVFPLLQSSKIPVMAGFIASTANDVTTTLGRGGSDYTAALVGAALNAREIQIWTDVSGMLTADPRVVSKAQTIPRLSYNEAAELAYFGAKVLHPKTIHPAVEGQIPLRICNSRAPEEIGTVVCADIETVPQTVKAIAHKAGITMVQITSARMLGAYGFLHAIFDIFDRYKTAVDVVTTSEVSVSLSLDNTVRLPGIIQELQRLGAVEVEEHRAIVSVVGEGLKSTPGVAGRIFSTISDINVSLVSLGASSINLTFSVDQNQVAEVVRRLHSTFFEQESKAQSKSG